jgi:hypothetical protein
MTIQPVTGILWWKSGQWEIAKQISDDSSIFDDTYEEWKEAAEKAVSKYKAEGLIIYKVEVDLDDMAAWCREQNRPLDATARTHYVSIKVKELHESG